MRLVLVIALGLGLLGGCGKADDAPVMVQDLRKRGKPIDVAK